MFAQGSQPSSGGSTWSFKEGPQAVATDTHFNASAATAHGQPELKMAAPLIHTSKGAQPFQKSEPVGLLPEELSEMASKTKARDAEKIEFQRPVVGIISLAEWQYHVISTVAAAVPILNPLVIFGGLGS